MHVFTWYYLYFCSQTRLSISRRTYYLIYFGAVTINDTSKQNKLAILLRPTKKKKIKQRVRSCL